MNFKFGVIYAKAGQIIEDELFSNETGNNHFDNFLKFLDECIRMGKLKGELNV